MADARCGRKAALKISLIDVSETTNLYSYLLTATLSVSHHTTFFSPLLAHSLSTEQTQGTTQVLKHEGRGQ